MSRRKGTVKPLIKNNDDKEINSIPHIVIDPTKSHITVNKEEATQIFQNGYFGTWIDDETLALEPEELLLLVERGRIKVFISESEEEISPKKLVDLFRSMKERFWSQYLVYKDLRNRGYVVKVGTQVFAPLRIYPRGGKPGESVSKITIYPFPEGSKIDLEFLDQLVSQARTNKKRLLLAVIDRLGDVTYYQASQLELKANPYEYEYKDELDERMESS